MKIKGEMYKELDRQIEAVFADYPIEEFDKLLNAAFICCSGNKKIKSPSVVFIRYIYLIAMRKHDYSWQDMQETKNINLNDGHIETALKRIIPNYYPAIKPYLK